MTDHEIREECLNYFRERPALGSLLKGFREKYLSYGRFAGTVTLRNLKDRDREELEGFLRSNYHGKRSASVSAERFEKALADSRFAGISGKEVLELYFQETLEGKKEQRLREEEQWAQLLERERAKADGIAAEWLAELADSGFSSYLKKRYREEGQDFREAERLLGLGARILSGLPAGQRGRKPVYLAVFASEITGNPHAFDDGTKDGRYLELLVEWYVKRHGKQCRQSGSFPALRRQDLYLRAGLLRDDVSNYALAAGIRAVGSGGRLHAGMEGFFAERQPVQIPLSVIAGWQSAFCPGGRIYIVENPSVYAVLCEKWQQDRGLMCTNGQPRLSSLLLLELLAAAGTEVWYAGDLDPEGLMIAQRLRQYYPGPFHYWHMSPEDYRRCMSGKDISERRLKMLEKITDAGLKDTASAVKAEKKAGYQENMVQVYLSDCAGNTAEKGSEKVSARGAIY